MTDQAKALNLAVAKALTHSLKVDPDFELQEACKRDLAQAAAIVATIEPDTIVINCVKTGQPIGQLFANCLDSHIPHACAANWLRTDTETLNKHRTTTPIAFINYYIHRLALPTSKAIHSYYSKVIEPDTRARDVSHIDTIAAHHEALASTYQDLSKLTASELLTVVTLLTELGEFLCSQKEQAREFIQFLNLPELTYPLVVSKIVDIYVNQVEGYFDEKEMDRLPRMSETNLTSLINDKIRQAKTRIRARTKIPAHVNKLVTTNRRRSEIKRKLDTKEGQVRNIIDTIFADNDLSFDNYAPEPKPAAKPKPKPKPVPIKAPSLSAILANMGGK